jgi:uncharacterized DUF497 family protein
LSVGTIIEFYFKLIICITITEEPSLEQHLLLVIYVEKEKRNWIISARQATRNERKLYEQTRR